MTSRAPRRRGMLAGCTVTPSRPTSHIHQGAFMMGPSSGTERRTTAVVANRTTVPTRNESAAASTGPPTTWRSWLLMANCVGAAIPAARATGSNSSQVILFTLLAHLVFMGSARLVDVVEDRLYAVFPDPGAVLDVAGALEIGEGRLHPVFEAGDLLFELGQLGRIEDHVFLVIFLPDLPQPAPKRIGFG